MGRDSVASWNTLGPFGLLQSTVRPVLAATCQFKREANCQYCCKLWTGAAWTAVGRCVVWTGSMDCCRPVRGVDRQHGLL